MKLKLLFFFGFFTSLISAQSVIQNVNSGSVIAANSSLSIGEIVVNPVSSNQSPSGLVGILAQINEQLLEVPEFEISHNITVYPNPTQAAVHFQTTENLNQEKVSVYSVSGQRVMQQKIDNNMLDLNGLSSGQYIIRFEDKNKQSFQIIKK